MTVLWSSPRWLPGEGAHLPGQAGTEGSGGGSAGSTAPKLAWGLGQRVSSVAGAASGPVAVETWLAGLLCEAFREESGDWIGGFAVV